MESKPTAGAAYQQILEDHRELMALLNRIDQTLAERRLTMAEVGDLIGRLGDRLVKHFATEEEGGYFSELIERAPQLIVRANELMAQHPKMCRWAQDLIVEFHEHQNPDDWWQETRRRFDAFRQELLKHERSEDGLLQEAYTDDLGSHD